jgi:DNA-binding MarR family transcriptional regulator
MASERTLPVGPALIRASSAVNEFYELSSAAVGLNPQAARLLFILARKPTNMLGLSAALRLSKSTMTGVVDRLEAAGLIVREVDPYDRRQLVVIPTKLGAAKALEFENELKGRVTHLVDVLDETQKGQLAELLTILVTRAEVLTELEAART